MEPAVPSMPSKTVRNPRRIATLLGLGLGVGISLWAGGCIGHNNIEPIPGAVGFEDPNNAPVPQIMAASLRWLVLRYPPQGGESLAGMTEPEPFAVSLPLNVRGDTVEWLQRQTFPGKMQASTLENQDLPTYLFGRVWVRGDMAYVDIFRPVQQLASPSGGVVYQPITLHMRGGMQNWHFTSHRIYQPGSLPVPERTVLTRVKAFEDRTVRLSQATAATQAATPAAEQFAEPAASETPKE